MNEEPLPELPELREGILTDDELRLLLDDVERHGERLDVAVRRGRGGPMETGRDVAAARRALLPDDGPPAAVRLRYHFEGVEWRDTLMPVPGGFRLIRAGG
ncbi:MAG: hypothetical protein ACF8XB_00355 [Planctomycetota bacterium JB042]